MPIQNVQSDFIAPILRIVDHLTTTTLAGPEKLERVAIEIETIGESADNLTSKIPTIGPFVNWVMDLPPVDNFQRQYIYRPIAEVVYQGYKIMKGAIGELSQFARGIIDPLMALINEVASTNLSGAEKHARVKHLARELILGFAAVTQFFPEGLRNIVNFAISTDMAQDAINALAGMIAEVLYQVWKLLHGRSLEVALA